MRGPLIILSGPSGSGKSTVSRRLLETCSQPLHLSISATTRAPRPEEIDGVDYHFWTRERFENEKRAGAFLEWATVHGNSYGTLRREVEQPREQGQGVILDIDVQGATQVRKLYPEAIAVFLRTSNSQTCEDRIRKRGADDEAAIQRRLAAAKDELAHAAEYDYQVTNDDLESAVAGLREIVDEQFHKGATNAG
jgi:guanylate kinase